MGWRKRRREETGRRLVWGRGIGMEGERREGGRWDGGREGGRRQGGDRDRRREGGSRIGRRQS